MFQNIRELDKLPPTREAFRQHALRANYQAFCWLHADVAEPILPAPTESSWKVEETGYLVPIASPVNLISLKDLELISSLRFIPKSKKKSNKYPLLWVDNHSFRVQKLYSSGKVLWYCSRRANGCKAAVLSENEHVVEKKGEHCHEPPLFKQNKDGTWRRKACRQPDASKCQSTSSGVPHFTPVKHEHSLSTDHGGDSTTYDSIPKDDFAFTACNADPK
ncbi:FLYWCH zinc finger domain-containing protein [Phthorimaea operculella]|nr:FLYWCH zinc finger domain-containing protein [Phthorimaea operculella]